MSALRQWLVQPANPDTPCYITNKPDVAQKRADAGDIVLHIDRHTTPNREPGFIKVRVTEAPLDLEKRYGNTDARLKKLAEEDDEL